MPYIIADKPYKTKEKVRSRCQEILAATPDESIVDELSTEFLFDLFQYHDEWAEKSVGGIQHISTQTTLHGTRCFTLVRKMGEKIDISFRHAIKLIPCYRTDTLTPQELLNFKSAARTSVNNQKLTFRNEALLTNPTCPYTGAKLTRQNCAVDHIPPKTFDQLLFDFCCEHSINPLNIQVDSINGTVAAFADHNISTSWEAYHQRRADLRLLSRIGNLQLPKTFVPWHKLFA